MKNILLLLLICFTSFIYGQGTFDFGISKMNRFSGSISTVIDLPGTGEFNPAWSPNRRFVAFDVVSPVDPHRVGVSTSSGSLVTVFSGSADGANNPTWSANGRMIAVDKVPFGDLSVYTINVLTGSTSLLISDAVDPAFSNRGGFRQYLAFTRPSDGMIYTYHMLSGTITPITPGENAKWSPNDRALVYSLGGDVYTIRLTPAGGPSGLPVLQAGDPLFTESRPDWLSINQIVFHADYTGDFDLYRKRLRGSTAIIRIGGNSGTNDFDPDYNRSGRFILFAEGQPATATASIRNIDLGNLNITPTHINDYMNLTISISTQETLIFNLYSLNGELVQSEKLGSFQEGQHTLRIGLMPNVSSGMYMLNVIGDHTFNQTKKIIKI